MKRFLGIVIVIAFAVITSSAVDWCNERCWASGTLHTMCRYWGSNSAVACGRKYPSYMGLTDDEKKEIVDAHNKHRSYVAQGYEIRGKPGPQPPAANMQTMSWDDEIAGIAQRWANQCRFGYDACRHVDRFLVGQNVGRTSTSTGNVVTRPSDIVDIWYNQVKDMDRNQVSRLTSTNGVEAYTQLVWAKSNKVGCGKIEYKLNVYTYYYMVCNYGPSGNFLTDPVYEVDVSRNNLKNNVSINVYY